MTSGFATDRSATPLSRQAHALSPLFEALDLAGAGDGNVPPGTMPMLWRALADMQRDGSPREMIARTEALLIAIHRLQAALRLSGVERRELVAMLRGSIRTLSYKWMLDIRMT